MQFESLCELPCLFEISNFHKASVSRGLEAFSTSERPPPSVLTDEGVHSGPPSKGVSSCSRQQQEVNFPSLVCGLMPGCSESSREWRSVGLIGFLLRARLLELESLALGRITLPGNRHSQTQS